MIGEFCVNAGKLWSSEYLIYPYIYLRIHFKNFLIKLFLVLIVIWDINCEIFFNHLMFFNDQILWDNSYKWFNIKFGEEIKKLQIKILTITTTLFPVIVCFSSHNKEWRECVGAVLPVRCDLRPVWVSIRSPGQLWAQHCTHVLHISRLRQHSGILQHIRGMVGRSLLQGTR